jgi:hypothetical protein
MLKEPSTIILGYVYRIGFQVHYVGTSGSEQERGRERVESSAVVKGQTRVLNKWK